MRTILHSDINNCYVSIESIIHPEYKNIPFAVCGDPKKRHGIILAKNEIAKSFGIKTGEPVWQAKRKCPVLKAVLPHFALYKEYCQKVRDIYNEYTDKVEGFGPDEAWLDVTQSTNLFGGGEQIAQEISERIKTEVGLTVSIGVSFNKIFAKFGSDYKKPDGITVITPENFREIVWKSDISALLYVGEATRKTLNRRGIYKIGDIAAAGKMRMKLALGKAGEALYYDVLGENRSEVLQTGADTEIKTIGNSSTPARDIISLNDAKILFYALSESIASRLRKLSLMCGGIQISLRDTELHTIERQIHLDSPTDISDIICSEALKLLEKNWDFSKPLRSAGIRGINLVNKNAPVQCSLFLDNEKTKNKEKLELAAQKVRERYGSNSIRRAILLNDRGLCILPDGNNEEPKVFRSHGEDF